MKKLSLLLLVSILLVACGQSDKNSSSDNSPKESDGKNVEEEVKSSENKEENEPEVEEVLTITKGNALVIDDYAEITINNNVFGKQISPPNPSSMYTYYKNEEEGEVYLDTSISVKSLLTTGQSSDEFVDVKIIYDEKYEYKTFSTIEDRGGEDFTFTNITSIEPLKTGTLHFLASVPEQVEKDGKPLKAIITVKGQTYEQIIR
ncbi:hypothetical protein [Lysinibacillus irui]|uniref:hypothetical protein n=1 Tax=Lysinibacillus irui TaxID=2998077 RepID=UPI002AD2757C|nr:hypothetical protein [Lysinibacillus irui]MEA0565055.1 hypothetical protein [Lysinibacillus irui]